MSAKPTRGVRIARRRAECLLTQEALARLCGCSLRTIQRIEDDENPGMSQRIFEALHEHLGIPLSDLVSKKRSRARGA